MPVTSHSRQKTIAADDDYDYDDEEEDYDNEEDDKKMREGTAQARELLGSEFTDKEIQESLWHYYYDVDKTVNYLLSRSYA